MSTLFLESQYHRAFFIAALVISISNLFATFLQKRTDRPQNKWFITLLVIIICNTVAEIFTTIFEPLMFQNSLYYYGLLFSHNFYFYFHTALCPMLYVYVCSVTGQNRRRTKRDTAIIMIPFFITEFFAIINPLCDCVYYYDEQFNFVRNWAEYLIYGAAALYFTLSVLQLLFSWNSLTHRKSIALTYLFVVAFLGVTIQLINQDIKTELFAEAIALMGAMIAIESEEDRLDADTEIYNRRALQMDIKNILTMKEEVSLIYVKINNANIIERVTRSTNYDVFSIAVADYLKSIVPKYKIYHPNKECFVIILSKYDNTSVEKLIIDISLRFNEGWKFYGTAFKLDAIIMAAEVPSEVKTYDDIIYIADSIIPPSVALNHAEIDWIMRRIEVERAIRNSLIHNGFEVYYQPTVNSNDTKIHGAEALVRMHDATVGNISPDEFIPIAEQIGLVDQIDDFVLNEVCKFINTYAPNQYKYDCINVNLSVIQCLQPDFLEHVLRIVDSYGVDHSYLNFEITESVGAEDYDALSSIAHKLKASGFSLSMDDYGTGFSNMEGIFNLEFDVIKIDKSILWNAEKGERGRIILENSIKMMKGLGCKVLVEGVETEKHVKLLQSYGVDYLQGYYFSTPIPKTKFIDYLSN